MLYCKANSDHTGWAQDSTKEKEPSVKALDSLTDHGVYEI